MTLANVFTVSLTHCVLDETLFHFQHTKGKDMSPKKLETIFDICQ